MEHLVSFGEWLRQRRRALDLTRAELAGCAACSVSHVRKIETDERRPSQQLAELLAGCLQIPPQEHPRFVKVARGVERVERLGTPLAGTAAVRSRRVPSRYAWNLPVPLTPLIGREPELAALARLLRDRQCRLVTVVGPGGIGKTRLAIEAASSLGQHFPDGICFVPLVSLTLPRLIVPAIADALGFALSGPVEPQVQLLSYLSEKSLLLLLDNFEHLLEAGGLLAELLQQVPGLKLLVTSRERLDLQGEWLFDLQGLPVPPLEQVDWAEEYSAVSLFVQSAQRVQAGFALKAEERLAVTRICQLVEGLPLAIELAAAWVRVLSGVEILSEIERGLDFLASETRDVPERHHSLRAVFDHSWDLLSADERRVLRRLAVFQGGFEREAARKIAGASLFSLSALVSKSLVHRSKDGRYDLHEVVRQYSQSRLADDPEGEATRDRHSDFYLALLRDREKGLRGATQRETIRELTDEIGNLRTAWAWAVKREKFVQLGQALRCFAWLHEMRGWFYEGAGQVDLIVQVVPSRSEDEGRQALLGQALAQQGLLLFRQGHFARAQSLFEESLAILRPLDDPALLLDALTFSGIILFLHGEMERSQALVEESLACATAADEPWFRAYALYNQGAIDSFVGRHDEAYQQMLAGIAGWRALGDSRATSLGLNWISPSAIKLGRLEEAEAFLEESLTLCREVGDRWGMGTAYRHRGLLALARGDLTKAQALFRESLDLFSGFVTGWDVVRSLLHLGEAVAATGDSTEARRIFLDALRRAMEAQAVPLAHDALVGLADLQARAGETSQALSLSLCVLNHAASLHEARARAERLTAELETQLTPRQIEVVRNQEMSLEAVVEALLESNPAAAHT